MTTFKVTDIVWDAPPSRAARIRKTFMIDVDLTQLPPGPDYDDALNEELCDVMSDHTRWCVQDYKAEMVAEDAE